MLEEILYKNKESTALLRAKMEQSRNALEKSAFPDVYFRKGALWKLSRALHVMLVSN